MKLTTLFSLVLALFLYACAGTTENSDEAAVATKVATEEYIASGGDVYICPCGGCPEVKMAEGGACPKCKMDLVVDDAGSSSEEESSDDHDGHDHGDHEGHDHNDEAEDSGDHEGHDHSDEAEV